MTRMTKSQRIMAHREKMMALISDLSTCRGYNITLKQETENTNDAWFRVICLERTNVVDYDDDVDGQQVFAISQELMSVLGKHDAYAFVYIKDGRKYLHVYFC